jgi:biotin carboxyl carrier protein
MEVEILSPIDGVCVKVHVKEGAVVDAHDTLMVVRPHCGEMARDT